MTAITRNKTLVKRAREALRIVDWCVYCQRLGVGARDPDGHVWHMDHIVPLALGGQDAMGNITQSCRTCNLRKNKYRTDEGIWPSAEDAEFITMAYGNEAIDRMWDRYWCNRRTRLEIALEVWQ